MNRIVNYIALVAMVFIIVRAQAADDNDGFSPKAVAQQLAADYVRGKVKTLRSEPRRGEFSSRQVESDDRDDRRGESEFDGRVDARGLGGNRGALSLVENVAESFGRDTKHEDSLKVWKESLDDEGRGVQIDSREEVERARKIISRGSNIGGQRGEK